MMDRAREDQAAKRYEVAIFDFDGTLAETPAIYPFVYKETLRELGVPEEELEYITLEWWCDFDTTSMNSIDMVDFLIKKHHLKGEDIAKRFRLVRNVVEMEYLAGKRELDRTHPFHRYASPAVITDLRRMHADGTRCFVVSHNYGSIVDSALRALGIRELFEGIYTNCGIAEIAVEEYDRNIPKRESFSEIASLASDPAHCVVYDDILDHIETARELGLDAVWVCNDHALPPKRRRSC